MFEDYTTNKKEEIVKAVMEAFYKDWINYRDAKDIAVSCFKQMKRESWSTLRCLLQSILMFFNWKMKSGMLLVV